jgi:glycosyltransferase involved in cell wall biosynthesis
MRILIVTDAWHPQVNGVVRTLETVGKELTSIGHDVKFITPQGRRCFSMPTYKEIAVSVVTARQIGKEIDALSPDAIHIATEGPLGWAARNACLKRKFPFTSSFHTRFAEYVQARIPVPGIDKLLWIFLRNFHKHSKTVMTPSLTISKLLEEHDFANVKTWTRGVDHSVFKPGPRDYFDLPRPITLFSGRITVEKNLEAFLKVECPGTKVLVGDGLDRNALALKYPNTVFTGYLFGEPYAHALASADCFVFPSLTDTFGLVMVEAMACGTPVAAFNVPSPIDVVEEGLTGCLDPDLAKAITHALKLDRTTVHVSARKFTWARTAEMFLGWLVPIGKTKPENTAPELAPQG